MSTTPDTFSAYPYDEVEFKLDEQWRWRGLFWQNINALIDPEQDIINLHNDAFHAEL